jgi:hypothetical protein
MRLSIEDKEEARSSQHELPYQRVRTSLVEVSLQEDLSIAAHATAAPSRKQELTALQQSDTHQVDRRLLIPVLLGLVLHRA